MVFQAVYLDDATLNQGDIDFSVFDTVFTDYQAYANTTVSEIVARLHDADVAIVNKVNLGAAEFAQLPKLKLILVSATGTNNIDLLAAQHYGIAVANCQAYGTQSVAQHTMALMLALATNLLRYDRAVKQGQWQSASQFCFLDYPIVELAGKTLGILGYGELGQAVAQLARAFGMNILIGQLPHRPIKADYLPLNEFLPQVDVLSLHCPLTDETRNLIDAKALAKMKKTALLINCARGGIVNEQALFEALHHQQIAGAATDVLTTEPPKDGNVLLQSSLTNLIITPHSAWGSQQARQTIVMQIAENAQAFLKGKSYRRITV